MPKKRTVKVDDDAEARINLQMARDIAKSRGETIKNGRVVRNDKSGGKKSGK